MDVLIYGAGNKGKCVLDLIKNYYKLDCEIFGFIDKNKSGRYQEYPIYRVEEIEGFQGIIIIALFDFDNAKSVCLLLKKKGYENIFWFQDKKKILMYENFFIEQCYNCKYWGDSILPQVEMHIIDSCNLNCRGCAHFSPIFPDIIPDIKSRLADVIKLKEKLSFILRFYILGGEPFLNPEISDYIQEIRKIMPETQLYIVTNGLLIEELSGDVLQCIKDNRVCVSISEYAPTHKKINNICWILDSYKILYEIREISYKEKFCLPLSLSDHSKYPRTCISNGCITIWNGKIARCPQLMYISYFNNYFNVKLPEDGVISLDNCIAGEELLEFLKKEIPLCKHCIKNEIEWSVCGKKANLEDFATFI